MRYFVFLMICLFLAGCSPLKWELSHHQYKHTKLPNIPGYENLKKVYVSPVILDIKRPELFENYEYSYQFEGRTINKKLKEKDTVRLDHKIRLRKNFVKVDSIEKTDFYIDFEILNFECGIKELLDQKNEFNDICSYKCKMDLKVKLYGDSLIADDIISKSGTINDFCMVQLRNKEKRIHPYYEVDGKFIRVTRGELKAAFIRKYYKTNVNFIINNWLWETKIQSIKKNLIMVEVVSVRKKDLKNLSDSFHTAKKQFYEGVKNLPELDPTSQKDIHIDKSIAIWKEIVTNHAMLKSFKEKKRGYLKGVTYYNIALGHFLLKRFDAAEKALIESMNYREYLSEEELAIVANLKRRIVNEKPVFNRYMDVKLARQRIESEKQKFIDNVSANIDGMQLELVEAGCFSMGQPDKNIGGDDYSDDEQPVHRVCLPGFYISNKEITIKQYLAFLNSINVTAEGRKNGIKLIVLDHERSTITYSQGRFVFTANEIAMTEMCPVTFVTWYGAKSYAEWVGGRLPTEAEWEYAASGGKERTIYSGSNTIDQVAWYGHNSDYTLKAVGLKKPNSIGLYDMSGNADEWCNDWYRKDYYSKREIGNPEGPKDGIEKIFRGGSCFDLARGCRIAKRNYIEPFSSGGNLGFRVVFDKN